MTIASEITRLQWAKADIKTAIENKWVTVPASAKLDTYDTYIDQIETWWFDWILWVSPIRVNVFQATDTQNVGNLSWAPYSYIYWDYLFIIAPYWTYSWDYQQWNIWCWAWKKWVVDYVATTTTISSSSDKWFDMVWAKITISWNVANIEICMRKIITDSNFYFYKLTNSFNMSNNTWWSWVTVNAWPTETNPYLSEYVWNLNLVSGDVEENNWAWIIRLFPWWSMSWTEYKLYTTSIYAWTSQGIQSLIYKAPMTWKYRFQATYNWWWTYSHWHSVEVHACTNDSGWQVFEDRKDTSTAKTVSGYFNTLSWCKLWWEANWWSYSSCSVRGMRLKYIWPE